MRVKKKKKKSEDSIIRRTYNHTKKGNPRPKPREKIQTNVQTNPPNSQVAGELERNFIKGNEWETSYSAIGYINHC